MTSLPIMKNPLISRMVDDVVSQCGVPSLSPRSFPPVGFDSANQARENGRAPNQYRRGYANRVGRTLIDLRRDCGINRLVRFRNAVSPEDDSSPFHDVGDCRLEPIALDILHSGHDSGLFGHALSERVRHQNLALPLVECRPLSRFGSAPICLRLLPQSPGLVDAEILAGVIHHRVEPAAGLCARELLCRDPLLEALPDRLPEGGIVSIHKVRAACAQFRVDDVRSATSGFHDGANPQNEGVPLNVLIGACSQVAPGHKQSILDGSIFAVESNAENEAVEVPSSHPRPVFRGRPPKLSVGFLLYQFAPLRQSSQSGPSRAKGRATSSSFVQSCASAQRETKATRSIAAPPIQLRRAREDVR
jgi:hypothetical protein